MIKPATPHQLAIDILQRSICSVQVGAAIADKYGILSWGWNSVGNGFGMHAEEHAIKRANWKRLKGTTIYVASVRERTGKSITSRPCLTCGELIKSVGIWRVIWRDHHGVWREEV